MSNPKQPEPGSVPVALTFDEFAPATYEAWEAAAGAAIAPKGGEPVKGPAFEKRMFTQTYEGITLHPMYTAEDTKALKSARTYPGLYALRGSSASGNLKEPWEMLQNPPAPRPEADPLGTLLETGDLPKSLDELWDDMARSKDIVFIRAGTVVHNGGANAVQEVAAAMTAAIETFRALEKRGVSIGDFAKKLRFEFSQGANFFMEIAKLRAARQVWAKVAESFGGDENAQRTEIFAKTSSFTKTVYDPYVNMLRNSTEAFSAVVGGADGLTVVRFDEAFKPESEFSSRQARNAQIMLQKEFNLLEPIDPAGGSWYVESLTDGLAKKIWAELQKIEGQGGFLKSIRDGLIQKDVEATLQERFKKLAKRSDRAVGTNMYPNMSEPVPDWSGVREAPAAGNTAVTPIRPRRWTEQFEALRRRTEQYKAAHNGDNVKIFLANMGPIPQHKARADFITGFMEVAAFEVLKNDGFKTTDECADAAAKSGALAAVICSTDKTYPELVPPLAKAIKEKAPSMRVFLAGEPAAEFKDAYVQAGVDGFISVRSNCLESLTELQNAKGM
ncbi:MAG: acyl-CoA mutase large subunit family protein [Fretibacterium sp.]|nr:acyl-CoA mutase large subunit family protein [Fretibacterium sp.]